MYYIKYNNDNVEAINRVLKYAENQAEILTFNLIPSSPFFLKFKKFLTLLDIYEDNEKILTLRVINTKKTIDSQGQIIEKVTCEGALNFLNDTRCGKWAIHPGAATGTEISWQSDIEKLNDPYTIYENMDIKKYLKLLLDTHNSKASADRKVYLGNVEVEGSVYCYNNRETILNSISEKLVKKNGGVLNLRKTDGNYYLDYLNRINYEEGLVELGTNITHYSSYNDLQGVYTRITPIGADGLTIKSVNGGVEYIENTDLVKEYGIIEKTIEFTDVKSANTLLSKGQQYLGTINNSNKIYEVNAVDISYISDNFTKFKLSQNVKIINNIFNDNDLQRIVSLTIPLDEPYKVTLNISALATSSLRELYNSESELKSLKIDTDNLNSKLLQKVNDTEYKEDLNMTNTSLLKQQKFIIMGV